MKEEPKYKTCIHAEKIGTVAVYVHPSCRHVTRLKGFLVSTKKTCEHCDYWERRSDSA